MELPRGLEKSLVTGREKETELAKRRVKGLPRLQFCATQQKKKSGTIRKQQPLNSNQPSSVLKTLDAPPYASSSNSISIFFVGNQSSSVCIKINSTEKQKGKGPGDENGVFPPRFFPLVPFRAFASRPAQEPTPSSSLQKREKEYHTALYPPLAPPPETVSTTLRDRSLTR